MAPQIPMESVTGDLWTDIGGDFDLEKGHCCLSTKACPSGSDFEGIPGREVLKVTWKVLLTTK